MQSTCPRCGNALRLGAHFCQKCGYKFQPTPLPQPKTPSGTQFIAADTSKLIVRESGIEREIQLTGAPLNIGRDPSNDIVVGLPNQFNSTGLPDISRLHARLSPSNSGYVVEDRNSANGTFLRGQRLSPSQPMPLHDGDVIRIGAGHGNSVSLTFQESATPMAAARTVAIDQMALANLPRITIGRNPNNTLVLNVPTVSAHHAEIVRVSGRHELKDLGSTNGTFVNGARTVRHLLNSGDVIQIGPYRFAYSPTGVRHAQNAGEVRLDGVRVRKEVRDGGKTKVLLDDISLTVMPREFIALVGGSGAGKSTLMDALNGSRRATGGQVLINGDNLYQNFDAYRADMGYVPQADILHTNIPVKRALRYTAMLRLPPDTSLADIEKNVNDALDKVKMKGKEDLPIYKLSGGQKKRVSIASELLSQPSLLFLDEPTSGLDPGLDKQMMDTLNSLADEGRTIVLTTHATNNILNTCHHVAFLAHGRLVYFGPPANAMKFFNAPDFATIYGMVETPPEAQKAEQDFKSSPDHQHYVASRQHSVPRQSGASKQSSQFNFDPRIPLRQFGILAMRYLDLIFNDKFSLFVLSAVMPIIGILLLVIANAKSLVGDTRARMDELLRLEGYYNIVTDAQKLLLMLALSVILLGVFAAAYEIIKERPVYNRERMINLGIVPYLASKIVVLMLFGLVQTFLLLLVVAFKVELPAKGVFLPAPLEIYISLMLAMLASISLGLLISALVKSGDAVIYLILVVLFVQIIFSGALFTLPDSAKPVSYITPTRWALESMGATVDMNELNKYSQTEVRDEGPMKGRRLEAKVEFSINYDRTIPHLWGTWFVQLFFAASFIGATMVVLKSQDVR